MEGTLFLILVQDLQLVFASLGTGPARGGLSKFLPFMNSVQKSHVSGGFTCFFLLKDLMVPPVLNIQQGRRGLCILCTHRPVV